MPIDTTPTFRSIADLLAGKLPSGPLVGICLRVSAQSLPELEENVQRATTKLSFLPAIAHLGTLDLPLLLLDKSAAGANLRARVGLIPILRANAHRWALEPGSLMGYALPVPSSATVILMLFDSAAHPTVQSPDEALPSNAVCSILVDLCMKTDVQALYFAEWDRGFRDPRYGTDIRAGAQMGGVDIYVGADRMDITTSTGTLISGVKDGESSGERNKIRTRTTGGTVSKLKAARIIWPYARHLLPPGYDLAYDREHDEKGKVHKIAYVRGASGAQALGWQAWAEAVAAGVPYLAAARHLAAHRVSVRGARHVNMDGTVKTYDELNDEQLTRASSSLAQHVRTLRHRRYIRAKDVPVPLRRGEDFEGHPVDHDNRGRYMFGTIPIDVELPCPSITLDDAQWEAWDKRVHGRTPRDTSSDGSRAPFGDIRRQWYVTAAGDQRDVTNPDWTENLRIQVNGDSYEVFRRSRADAMNDRGELRGWDGREGEHLYSMRRADLERAYAQAGAASAVNHLAGFSPVTVAQRPLPDPVEQERRRVERLAEIDELITKAADKVEDAELVHKLAVGRQRGVETAAEEVEVARANWQVLTDERHTLRAPAAAEPQAVLRTVSVDISSPARLFGILEGAAGRPMPRTVPDMLHALSVGRFRVVSDLHLPRMLRISDTLDWPTDEGTVLPLRLSFPVENRKRDVDEAARELARRNSAAALVLCDGDTVEGAARVLGWTREQTVTRVRSWLLDHEPKNVPSRGGRSAITDCPLPETKRAVYMALMGQPLNDEFSQLIVSRYLAKVSHANSWVGRDVTLERRVMAAIVSLLSQGVDTSHGLRAEDIAARAQCTVQQVQFLCDGRGSGYRGVLARVEGPGRRVLPHRCAAGHWLLHVLPTLETATYSGLLCSTCHTTPDGVPVPPGYFELWNGPSSQHDLAAGPGTTLTEAAVPVAPGARPRELLTIGEAAAHLRVSTSALRVWSNDGLVACERRPRRYDKRVLESADVQSLAQRYHDTYGQRTYDDVRLTLRDVSERLGAPEHYIREFLITPGTLPAHRGGPKGNMLLFDADEVDAVPQEWRDRHAASLVGIGSAAKQLGMTIGQLRADAVAGRVSSLLSDGGTRRFRPEDLDAHCLAQAPA